MGDQIVVYAYLDPATGSLVVQALIAGMVSVGFIFRRVFLSPWAYLFGRRPAATDPHRPSEDGARCAAEDVLNEAERRAAITTNSKQLS